jgi:hypothetical protein
MDPAPPPRARWRRVVRRVVVSLFVLVVLGVSGFAGWLAVGDDADPGARAAAIARHDVTVDEDDGVLTIRPADGGVDVGVVFLPGARIERGSYVATWAPIVERTGVHVFVPGVPLNLPLLGGDHVDAVRAAHPEIAAWIVGGHSLGGFTAASSLAAGDRDDVLGLLLWAAGPGRADLRALEVPTLVVAGAADEVVPLPMVRRGLGDLPMTTVLVVIDGMSHGQFGRYREVDANARRSDEATLAELVAATTRFLVPLLPT